jgi:small GTP-binding protein
MKPEVSVGICVVGQQGVGKSSLTLQFTQSHFPTDFDPTVEDVYQREMEVEGTSCIINVLDTASQDDYSHMKDRQFAEADAFVIAYSVGDVESFALVGNYYRHIVRVCGDLPPTILVGTQADLDTARQVSSHEGEQLANKLDIPCFIEVSAKLSVNVCEPFEYLAQEVMAQRKTKNDQGRAQTQAFTTGASPAHPDGSKRVPSPKPSKRVHPTPKPDRAYNREVLDRVEKSGCCVIM